MHDAVLARENPVGLRIQSEAMKLAPLTELGRFDEAEALGRRLLDEAMALGSSMVLSIVVTTATGGLLMSRAEPDGRAALAVFAAYDHLLASPGKLMEAWLSVMRSLALTTEDVPAAVIEGVNAARVADQGGSSAALSMALDVLSYAVALDGRLDVAHRLVGAIDPIYLSIAPGPATYRARRDGLLASLTSSAAPKPTRQELLAILGDLDR
jgi:hypothetical protein